jgi:hypothetical protein
LAYQFMAWLYQNPNLSTKEICFAVGKAFWHSPCLKAGGFLLPAEVYG